MAMADQFPDPHSRLTFPENPHKPGNQPEQRMDPPSQVALVRSAMGTMSGEKKSEDNKSSTALSSWSVS